MKNKINFLIILSFFVLLVFSFRLFNLQIISNYNYLLSSLKNLEIYQPIEPLRGLILDRNDQILATNKPLWKIYLVKRYRTIEEIMPQIYSLQKLMQVDLNILKEKYEKTSFGDKIFLNQISDAKLLARLLENSDQLPDIRFEDSYFRFYPEKESMFHLLGYLGSINQSELLFLSKKGYDRNDLIGKLGLEKQYDIYLRGKKGKKVLKTNAFGQIIDSNIIYEPENGFSLKLSIDSRLQRAAYKLLEGYRGSVIVSNAKTGEILVLVSSPSIDPNLFISGMTTEQFNQINNNPDNPFLFRPISAEYPPASTFKIFMAVIALDSKAIDTNTRFLCNHIFQLGDREFKCLGRHGLIDISTAIKDSCNIFFYNTALKTSIATINQYARILGFGKASGIDLPGESAGFIPSAQWKVNKYNEPWFDGDTLNISIGQGFLLVTPLQMNLATAMIANEGYNYLPHLVNEIIDLNSSKIIHRVDSQIYMKSNIAQWVWKVLKQAMKKVVDEGTARYGGTTAEIEIAGKTGTAQNMGLPHSWFTAFGPYEDPELVITVMVENSGYGASIAAPIASILFDMYYGNKSLEQAKIDIQKAWYKKYLKLLSKGLSAHDDE
ncbi:MAG: penicillin-binding protein 2 [Exilispira sp.]